MQLSNLDLAVLGIYGVCLLLIALYVSREKPGHKKNTRDYFLAGKALPWWAIGSSLIAANISAEQIIGMSGSGYLIGLGIATYEWTAAIALIVVGKYFLPIYLQKNIYTMPQFLEQRYDRRVRTVLAVFWLGVYIFVNLTAVLYLGGLAVNAVTGLDMYYAMLGLVAFSLLYSLYGGLKAVALTDIFQIVILMVGGFCLTAIALNEISESKGVYAGFMVLWDTMPEKFDMILAQDHPFYKDLPGLSVLLGGLWIAHFAYWGINQYITQRALAAASLNEARKGILFAAGLKLILPLIVVIPGIAAVKLMPGLSPADRAYPALMQLLPSGFLGLTFAALVAAIVSSLSSMTNSISTIFTMDLYKSVLRKDSSERHLVFVGRTVSVVSLLIAVTVARPLLGQFSQAFQYIQEFTGFFSPGILVIFLLGFFWDKATSLSAIVAALASVILSFLMKVLLPDFPFLDRMGVAFCVALLMAVAVTQWEWRVYGGSLYHDIARLDNPAFATTAQFNVATLMIVLVLVAFYTTWW
ncbi:sodium/solute symporter [Exilibacterium tricleocarpae]|uniref:Sodium/solute symporter n=1 Tax=Exilibacterium tricleocarpae TaxID=2591008 RepID=A0A545TSA3_9GAMM|nr:sodium/sugar symporter [Exilibacterium tricleocarpae]TQV80096.1 sodium/solute symporter [Exilibacterium tricleocarpae]